MSIHSSVQMQSLNETTLGSSDPGPSEHTHAVSYTGDYIEAQAVWPDMDMPLDVVLRLTERARKDLGSLGILNAHIRFKSHDTNEEVPSLSTLDEYILTQGTSIDWHVKFTISGVLNVTFVCVRGEVREVLDEPNWKVPLMNDLCVDLVRALDVVYEGFKPEPLFEEGSGAISDDSDSGIDFNSDLEMDFDSDTETDSGYRSCDYQEEEEEEEEEEEGEE